MDTHVAFVIALGRLDGLLEGRYEEDWCGETFAMLGRVHGAGGLLMATATLTANGRLPPI